MRILAFTSIRSDYDLMSPLYRLLHEDDTMDFQLLVSGAHLSRNYGYSINEIEKDGFKVLAKIETLLNSDSKASRVKSASLLLQGSIDIVSSFDPDLILYAGDREDALIAATIGGYLEVPSIHFYAGDHVQDGYIDNPVRHAISKLSTFQFVTLEEHKQRLVGMGELEDRVHVVGNVSLDKFIAFSPLSNHELSAKFNVEIPNKFALVIFHPVSEERDNSGAYFENILTSLKEKGYHAFVSYPNVDPGNFSIIEKIKAWEKDSNFTFFKNLDRKYFLSLYKKCDLIIGNSSSGICEAASIPVSAINVGLRQIGRYADENVVFCETSRFSILEAINTIEQDEFTQKTKRVKNSYGQGKSALKSYELIKSLDFNKLLYKKEDPLKKQ